MSEHTDQTAEPQQSQTNGVTKEKNKLKVDFESVLDREEAVQYFSAILEGLKQGTLTFKQGDKSLTVRPSDHLKLEVKATRKGRESKVSFEISWKDKQPIDLGISSER